MYLPRYPIVTSLALALGLLAGCKTPPKPGQEPPASMSLSNFADCQKIGPEYVPAERQATQTLNAALCTGPYKPNPNKAPINVLSLSAGGKYAAYCGGVIVGWGEHGSRPKFDVVAGMSGGALISIHALLGAKYDDVIRRQFTTLKGEDFFKFKPVYYLLTSRTLGTSDPLKRLLDREVHDELVTDLAGAHAEGRRCLVGTMNLHTRRLAVWDLTAIAASDRPDRRELIKKILLASGSIPGLVDPVEFDVTVNGCRYVEQHCDGGAVCQGFFRLTADQAPDGRLPVPPASNLYCMGAGKLYSDPLVGELGFIGKIRSATSGTLYAMYRGDLYRMYTVAVAAGLKFHLCAIPQDFEIKPESMKIDQDDLRKLFNLGYCEGKAGGKWRFQPPGSEPGEEEMPRTGTDYYIDNAVRGDLFPQTPKQMAEPPRNLPDQPTRTWWQTFPIFHSAVAK
jgi:hypothetical protein